MAVVQPSNRLEQLVLEQNRRRTTDWAKTAGSTAAGTAVGLGPAGPQAGIATAHQLFQPPPGSGDQSGQQMGEMALKKDIADAMAKYSKDINTGKLTALERMSKQEEMFKAIIGASESAFGHYAGSLTGAAASYNQARTELNKTWSGALVDVVEQQNAGSAPLIKGTFEAMRDAMSGTGAAAGPDVATQFAQALADLNADPGGRAGAAALVAKLEMAAQAVGKVSLDGWLQDMARTQGPGSAAEQALHLVNEARNTVEYNQGAVVEAIGIDNAAVVASLKMGVPALDKSLDLAKKFYAEFGGLTDPDEIAAAIEKVLKGGPDGQPGDTTPMETYEKLLAELDQDNLPPASNLAEARRRLLSDPEFLAWMRSNGFQDPAMALKELRRMIGDKANDARAADRQLMQQRRAGGVDAYSGGPSPGALATGPAGAGGKAPAPAYESTWVRDESGMPWFFGEDGKLRQPTPEELDELDQDIQKAGPGGFDKLVEPASRFAELQASSDQTTRNLESSTYDKAQAESYSNMQLPEPKVGMAQVGAAIGSGLGALYHPRQTGRDIKAGIQQLMAPRNPLKRPKTSEITDEFPEQS